MKDFAIQYKPASNGDFDLNIEVRRNSESKIISGLLLGPTLEQNIACLLIAESGDYKGNPDLGVGLRSALLGDDLLGYRHSIKEQFAKDGINIKHLNLYNLQKFEIDAEYE
ncbi:hypothetical protein [Bergeyella cardium]|uniref:Uncharacterized protein n=1 Tax=Bergeyella cardium TaxID=1585976 RepID=A0A6P1QRX0_9FLAO|nr:hypothetical protein [Bergeyella cardium]QHN64842.1 hypothetical protein DBX24_02510 [Bergeyella cardium]WHE34149.1 hypothetical protein P8603_02525 [Bergeyella cardium]WHF60800.1 hypothetical protein O0R51_02520 [Bergeyella cardium]